MPTRVQRTRTAGQPGIPPGAVYVGRGPGIAGRWGNPFRVGVDADDAAHATALYEEWLANNSYDVHPPDTSPQHRQKLDERRDWILSHVHELAGKDLACWCKPPTDGGPDHCHAALLLRLANPYCTGNRCGDCEAPGPDGPDGETDCCEATCGCCPRVNAHGNCRLASGSEDNSRYCDQHGEAGCEPLRERLTTERTTA